MTPPAGSNNQDAPKPAIDTERMYKEMAEREDPREAARKTLEEHQKAEARRIQAEKAKGRSEVAADKSAERAAMAPGVETPPPAPAAAVTAPEANPTESPDQPAAAPAETPPTTPPTTPTTETPPAAPGGTTEAASTTPAADAEPSMGAKFKEFFGKIWESLKGVFASISAKFSEWTSGKKPEETAAVTPEGGTATSSDSSQTPAPAPGTSPPSSPPPASPSQSREKPPGADSTWGLKGNDLLQHNEFKARSQSIANKIGVPLDALYTIFRIESGADPAAVNKSSGASGLIQWMPQYTGQFGTTPEKLRQMSGLQQLDLVEKYFNPYIGKIHSFADMYRAVFFPASLSKPAGYVFGGEGKDFAKKVATQNSGIAKFTTRPDGLIDNECFDRFCATRYKGGGMPVA